MDIKLINDDFSIIKNDSSELLDYFDFNLESSEESYSRLIRRVVETPYNYIGRFVLTSNGLDYIDGPFGNGLYSQLSEGLTVTWITEANVEIRRALSFLDTNIEVRDIQLYVVPPDTVNIKITYFLNNIESFVTLPIGL